MSDKIKAELSLRIGLRPSAECNAEGCDWSHPCSKFTRQRAKDHVRLKAHPVIIETKTVEEWEPV